MPAKSSRAARLVRVIGAVAVAVGIAALYGSAPRLPNALPAAAGPHWTPVREQLLHHGRFQDVNVYVPHTTPRGFVLLLSGDAGWNLDMADWATHLAAQGAMVAGLDLLQFNKALESDGGQCVYPDGDLENLSHFVQAYFHLPTYLSPILAGYSAGGTLAYGALMQSPKSTFAGAVSVDFCPAYVLHKPLCAGSGIEFTTLPQGRGVEFLPSTEAGTAWTVVQTSRVAACDVGKVREFVSHVPGAQFVSIPTADGSRYMGPFETLMHQNPSGGTPDVPAALGDLPLVIVPAQGSLLASDTFAIILSGDGGWAGLDKDVAGALAAAGIPVIGLDSLRYFWSARTPQGLAGDLDRITRYYSSQLGKRRVLLIGYSQGADVLPFAVNRLDEHTRSQVALTAILGMSEHALFEFHMTSWVSDDNSGPATLPEVDRITGMPVLCVYGEEETDTLCPKLDPHKATVVKLKGGHHFDGDYANLARIILASARAP